MVDIQKLVNAMNEMSRKERSGYHLTLGEAVKTLSELPADAMVKFDFAGRSPCEPHSYRGYYSDIAFEATDQIITVAEFLHTCEDVIGQTFEGYKGGDFAMAEDTPMWVSSWGFDSGVAMMGLKQAGDVVTIVTKQID